MTRQAHQVEKYNEGLPHADLLRAKFGQCKFSMKEAPGEGLPVAGDHDG